MPSSQVFEKFENGRLHSGGPKGPVVTNRKQAIAIKMHEAANEQSTGSADIPKRSKPKRKK